MPYLAYAQADLIKQLKASQLQNHPSETDISDIEASVLTLQQGKETALVGLLNRDGQTSILMFFLQH